MSSANKEKVAILAVGATLGLAVPVLVNLGLKAYRRRRSKPMKLGYWKIRGLAQPIRLLMEYTGAPYEDEFYVQGDAPQYSREEWYSVKHKLGLPFPNLPYLIDGERKLVQSACILRYLGRQYDLLGRNEEEMVSVDLLVEEARDFSRDMVMLCYSPNFHQLQDEFISQKLPPRLEAFDAWLAPDTTDVKDQKKKGSSSSAKVWFVGSQPTIADFMIYEAVDQARILANGCLETKPYKYLKEFMNRFESLPAIQAYMASGRYFNRPLNNKVASFK